MIGIIILNYNTWKETVDCVNSIINTTSVSYKIYIIDNNSEDDSYNRLNTIYSDVQFIEVIKSQVNRGYSAGNNIGIKRALSDGADVIILSNSDVIYYKSSIDKIYNYLLNNDNIGILGPKVILQDNSIQPSPRKNYNFINYIMSKKPFIYFDFFGLNKDVYFKNYNYENKLIFKGLVSGCCIALSKKYFDLCGLLDEETFLYFEESIIAQKALRTDLMTCILPQSIVLHKSSLSVGNPNSAFSRYHRYYSSMYMLKKYVGINNLELLIISVINLFPFIIKSFNDKTYRYYIKKLFKNIGSLMKIK